MNHIKVKFRIHGDDYYLISWDMIHPDLDKSHLTRPSPTLLFQAFEDYQVVHKIRQALYQHLEVSRYSDSDLVKYLSDVLSNGREGLFLESRAHLSLPTDNARVLGWLDRAVKSNLPDASYCYNARNLLHLDEFDDNLSAAERYFDGRDTYNQIALLGDFMLKKAREIKIGGFKPIELIAGKNGALAEEFVTTWGAQGDADDKAHIDVKERIRLSSNVYGIKYASIAPYKIEVGA